MTQKQNTTAISIMHPVCCGLDQGKRMKFSAPDKLCEIFIIPACYLSFSFDAGLT